MKSALVFLRFALCLSASTSLFLFSIKAEAAEKVVLKYKILRQAVAVSELKEFAERDQLSPILEAFLNKASKNRSEVRQTLREEIKVNPILLSRVLNTGIGGFLLDGIADVIHAPDRTSSREALRTALVNSAMTDGKLTLVEVLENYPAPEIQVEGDRLADVYRQISKIAERLPRI